MDSSRDYRDGYDDGYRAGLQAARDSMFGSFVWKVTGTGLPMLLVRGSFEGALILARQIDPRYCGMQRRDVCFDGPLPPETQIIGYEDASKLANELCNCQLNGVHYAD